MSNVLIVAEQQGGMLRKATLHALGAGYQLAERLSGKIHVIALGKGIGTVAHELRAYADVVAADAPVLEHYLAEAYAPIVAEAARALDADYVGAASNAFGKDLLPRVAARLKAAMASDVLAFGGDGAGITFHRPMWADNVLAEVELRTPVKVFTIRPTEFSPAPKRPVAGDVIPARVEVDAPALKTRFVAFREVKSARPALTEARVVVAGGRGTRGNFREVEALADELGAAVGASRAAVDAGWVPNDWQVGQTGKVVAPELYIAAGISGAIQHLAGMKGSKVIVAINKDPEAPILQIADYGLVADLFEALSELRAKVKASR
ncbi:MAG TPA: electron transfer flavoprotein subunit alpha/FixB family protein [Anaeromyxobacteraceae bacterium]|nr:electron transfer flavoprotein subunit alpha/FixB family protein [Anaeromyxobacteraceae bacterium]